MKNAFQKIVDNGKTLLELQELIERLLKITNDIETSSDGFVMWMDRHQAVKSYQSIVGFLSKSERIGYAFNINILDYQIAVKEIIKELRGRIK